MILVLSTSLVLTAAGPVSLALPGFQAVNIGQPEADLYAELAAQELTARQIKVLTSRDITQVVGAERSRQLLGCSESGCIAEIANGLGADGLLVGDVGRIGSDYVLTVKVLSPSSGQSLALFNDRARKAELVPQLVKRAMWNISRQLAGTLKRSELLPTDAEPVVQEMTRRPSKWWAIAFGGLGAAGIATGAVLQISAGSAFGRLKAATLLAEAESVAVEGKSLQSGAWGCFIGGALMAATAVVWWLVFGSESSEGEAALAPQLSSGSLTWSLP